jgi:hypothetical protein
LIEKRGANVRLKPKLEAAYTIGMNGNTGGYASGYGFPFVLEVNDKPALSCNLAVVSARPPLLTCAGIIGIAAQSPDGKGPHLMVQLMAAHCGFSGAEGSKKTAEADEVAGK